MIRGPIDFIVVGFKGNKFDGSILRELGDAVNKGLIKLIGLSVIGKDSNGDITTLDVSEINDESIKELTSSALMDKDIIEQDDINEVSELLENNTAAGLLIIEHVWAKPLKQAITNAKGYLIADGRIHPDAAMDLSR